MITPEQFVSMFGNKPQQEIIKLGKVDSRHTTGKPKIIFDGETQASTKRYPYLASYTPVAGDRVLLIKGVVIGKIIK